MLVISSSFVHYDYLAEHPVLVAFLRRGRDHHFGTKVLDPGAVITHLKFVDLVYLTSSSFDRVLKGSLLFSHFSMIVSF